MKSLNIQMVAWVLVGLTTTVAMSCGGEFSASDCKDNGVAGVVTQLFALVTDVEGTDLTGLECVSWKQDGGTLSVDLINFKGGCGEEYDGEAEVDGHTVRLVIEEDDGLFDAEAGCGSCSYDFSFKVKDVPQTDPLTVSVKMEERAAGEVTIADDRRESGLICRVGADWDSFGTLHSYCVVDDAAENCEAGLVCVPDEEGNPNGMCYLSCEQDADCANQPVPMSCVETLCRLVESF